MHEFNRTTTSNACSLQPAACSRALLLLAACCLLPAEGPEGR